MRVPILAYHAVNIAGNDYGTNDHVAFAQDLRAIHAAGLRIVPVHRVVDALLGRDAGELDRCVALTCDDGSAFDAVDLEHPTFGLQRSLLGVLGDFLDEVGAAAQPHAHLTSFVIASPDARETIDRACLVGRGWMGEDWWRAAMATGRLAIESHSWDHNHAALAAPGPHGMARGSFLAVDDEARADAEIAQAARYIDARIAPARTRLFCYPYSEVPDYLRREYFPRRGAALGIDAAFGAGAEPATRASDRWNLPRYVCGWHWKTPEAFRAILRGVS